MRDVDLAVVGAGVAGLTAAMFAGRRGLGVLVIDQTGAGGQVMNSEKIENFPGFPQGVAGFELGPLLQEQAEAAGADVALDTVEALEVGGGSRVLRGAQDTYRARAVVIAAGSSLRRLGVPGEAALLGRGVSHCASCDGPLFAGQDVCVIGGGDAALDEALVLTQHAGQVLVVHRGPRLSAQEALLRRAGAAGNLEIALETTVTAIEGADAVTGVRLRDGRGGQERTEKLSGVFVFVGLEPNTAMLRGVLALDAAGHVETDVMMRTSLEGVFAAGDIRRGSVAQLASAAGDGATAALAAYHYLRGATGGGGEGT